MSHTVGASPTPRFEHLTITMKVVAQHSDRTVKDMMWPMSGSHLGHFSGILLGVRLLPDSTQYFKDTDTQTVHADLCGGWLGLGAREKKSVLGTTRTPTTTTGRTSQTRFLRFFGAQLQAHPGADRRPDSAAGRGENPWSDQGHSPGAHFRAHV